MPNKPKITVSLDEFDAKIIERLVGFEGQNKSEVIRVILHRWIIQNSSLVENQYGINFKDINREIELDEESLGFEALSLDILKFFKRAESIEINLLADKIGLSPESLLKLIQNYGDKLESKGLNLVFRGNLIVKL
jgi:Arc/MetJ-type ribon-helix-helix transcriptional regulator